MQTHLGHIQIFVRKENLSFYKDLLTFLGWQTIYGDDEILGLKAADRASVWFMAFAKDITNDYDGPGMNHLAIGTEAQADVDTTAEYLKERGVPPLFETPRHRPEFSESEAHTYYQVMFESPDRVLFEVVYTGLKAA